MSALAISRLLALACALLFSTGGVAIKSTSFGPWQVASFRSAIAAVAVMALVPAARRGWSWRVLPAGAAYAAMLILFVCATKLTTSANAIFLQSTAPLWVLLLGPVLLKERARRSDLVFAAVVAIGLSLFFVARETAGALAPDPVRGNLLGALSGVAWALVVMSLRWLGKHTHNGDGALASVVAGNAMAFLIALPLALPAPAARPTDWAIVIYLGVFQVGLAYLLLSRAIRHIPAFEMTTLLLVEPVFNPIWTWMVQGERPSAWALAGGALILTATFLHTWRATPR
ncbi:MAG: DMT family transporter [Acidobacteriota bacterium]